MAAQDNNTAPELTPKDTAVINNIRRIIEETRLDKENVQPGAIILPVKKYDSTYDDLHRALSQAEAVMALVVDTGEGEDFRMSHEVISNSIWCIQGLIGQALKIVEGADVKASTTHGNALSGGI